jgi:hypothetical protein
MAPKDDQRETLLRTIESRPELRGRFSDIRRLGTCGGDGYFSLIATARDSQSGDRVVLKFFHPDHLRDQYRWIPFFESLPYYSCFLENPTFSNAWLPMRNSLCHSRTVE